MVNENQNRNKANSSNPQDEKQEGFQGRNDIGRQGGAPKQAGMGGKEMDVEEEETEE
jgi:hypothetical protein